MDSRQIAAIVEARFFTKHLQYQRQKSAARNSELGNERFAVDLSAGRALPMAAIRCPCGCGTMSLPRNRTRCAMPTLRSGLPVANWRFESLYDSGPCSGPIFSECRFNFRVHALICPRGDD